jgi:hypothetical protein
MAKPRTRAAPEPEVGHNSGSASQGNTAQLQAISDENARDQKPHGNLADFLLKAVRFNRETYEPPGHGKPFRSPLWEFVRRAKRHPELRSVSAMEAANRVEKVIQAWGVETDQPVTWEVCFLESDDPRAEFIHTWPLVKWAAEALQMALDDATILPMKPMESFSSGYCRFVSLAFHLQLHVNGPILLPCAKVGEILGCSAMTVSRYRNLALQAGILERTCRGIKAQRKADEFQFKVELFDSKTGEQIHSENLKICLTSATECYTDTQDIERFKEKQDKQEQKEIKDLQRDRNEPLQSIVKVSTKRGPYIPTVQELEQELRKTEKLRYPMWD